MGMKARRARRLTYFVVIATYSTDDYEEGTIDEALDRYARREHVGAGYWLKGRKRDVHWTFRSKVAAERAAARLRTSIFKVEVEVNGPYDEAR